MNSTKTKKLLLAYLYAYGHEIKTTTEESIDTIYEGKAWSFSTVRDSDRIYVEYLDGALNFYKSGKLLTRTVLVSE